MKKFILLIMALCLAAFLVGCGGGSSSSDEPIPTDFSMAGTVTNKDGQSLKGYKVFLYNRTDKDPVANATTGNSGNFAFENLKPGAYKIIAFDSNEFEEISLEDYEIYTASLTPVVKTVVVYDTKMNTKAIEANNIVYNSKKTKSIFQNTGQCPIYITGDSRVIINAFGQEQYLKDTEHFNCYVKFDNGAISKVQGVVSGSKWNITKERPVCNESLSDFDLDDFSVKVISKSLRYIDGYGTYFGISMRVTSENPMYTPMSFFVSPEFGWFLEYTEDNEVFEITSIN